MVIIDSRVPPFYVALCEGGGTTLMDDAPDWGTSLWKSGISLPNEGSPSSIVGDHIPNTLLRVKRKNIRLGEGTTLLPPPDNFHEGFFFLL
jgi:hypothetical protein